MEKQRWEAEKRKSQKKEDAGARKGGKVAIHRVFPMICGSGGSKSRVRSHVARCEMKNCSTIQVLLYNISFYFFKSMWTFHQIPMFWWIFQSYGQHLQILLWLYLAVFGFPKAQKGYQPAGNLTTFFADQLGTWDAHSAEKAGWSAAAGGPGGTYEGADGAGRLFFFSYELYYIYMTIVCFKNNIYDPIVIVI